MLLAICRQQQIFKKRKSEHTVPILFLSRCTKIPLDVGDGEGLGRRGSRSGTTNADRPREPLATELVLARAILILESVADENHLNPSR